MFDDRLKFPQKCGKTVSSKAGPHHGGLPTKIRNKLYELSVFPNKTKVKPAEKIVDEGVISEMDTTRSFYLDHVTNAGNSELSRKKNINRVAEMSYEVLSLVTPCILFIFDQPSGLLLFVEASNAHTLHVEAPIKLHVDFDMSSTLGEDESIKFDSWRPSRLSHDREVDTHEIFET